MADVSAEALFGDYLILRDDDALVIDSPRAWAGVVRRIGSRALLLLGRGRIGAAEALGHGLCDEVVPA